MCSYGAVKVPVAVLKRGTVTVKENESCVLFGYRKIGRKKGSDDREGTCYTFFLLLGTSVRKTLAPIFDVFLGSFKILFIICLGLLIVICCSKIIHCLLMLITPSPSLQGNNSFQLSNTSISI